MTCSFYKQQVHFEEHSTSRYLTQNKCHNSCGVDKGVLRAAFTKGTEREMKEA